MALYTVVLVSSYCLRLSHTYKYSIGFATGFPIDMLTHRGFSAWVVSNGMVLPEHLVAVDEQCHRVSCWIPGTEGHVRSSLKLLMWLK